MEVEEATRSRFQGEGLGCFSWLSIYPACTGPWVQSLEQEGKKMREQSMDDYKDSSWGIHRPQNENRRSFIRSGEKHTAFLIHLAEVEREGC